MVKYYWDTYAIVLLLEGDGRISKYIDEEGITSTLNVMELCVYLLRNDLPCRKIVKEILSGFSLIYQFPVDVVTEAARLKDKKRREGKKWSYTDAMGYILALRTGSIFLTGDREFEGEKNVEFLGSH